MNTIERGTIETGWIIIRGTNMIFPSSSKRVKKMNEPFASLFLKVI